jgi:hypothetical protein
MVFKVHYRGTDFVRFHSQTNFRRGVPALGLPYAAMCVQGPEIRSGFLENGDKVTYKAGSVRFSLCARVHGRTRRS